MAHSFAYDLHFQQTPEKVWELIGNPLTLDKWHPAIGSCDCVNMKGPQDIGCRRHLKLASNGVDIFEDLTATGEHSYSYCFSADKTPPFPIAEYNATLRCEKDGDGTLVKWTATWNTVEGGQTPEETKETLNGVFHGLDNAKKILDES